jgi:tripartite-type tricarboxylate transporter receptor subunit TctC
VRLFSVAVLLLLASLPAGDAEAQAYPAKALRIVVGYPPGGSGDFLTRVMADELAKTLGVAVVAENKPGAGGNIAADFVAKSPADGYTLLNGNLIAINRALYKSLTYDDKDFIPISKVATGGTVIVINNNVPIRTLKELLEYAKANPGKLFNAQAGYGSAPNMAAAVFEAVSGVRFTPVQFKGGGPAAQSVLAGDTHIAFSTAPTVMGFIKGGRLRPLAVSLKKGSPSIPGIPGTEEAGLPDYEYTFWFGLFVPAGTPAPIVRRLHEASAGALNKPEVREKIAIQGMDATPSASPEAFAADIRAESPVAEKIVRDSGQKVE